MISYAIADVAAFVRPGDPIDLEAHRRGTTLYAPDCRAPLHPPVLSEGAASLLPNEVPTGAAVDDHAGPSRSDGCGRRGTGQGPQPRPAELSSQAQAEIDSTYAPRRLSAC